MHTTSLNLKITEFSAVCESVFARGRRDEIFPGGTVHFRSAQADFTAAYGFRTYAEDEPVAPDTLYDVASLTKLFTATALLCVAEEYGLPLEASLGRFFSAFATPELQDITLLHLLRHQAGLAVHVQELAAQPRETWLGHIARGGLVHPPGQGVRYTCTAYVLLGWVIEAVTGGTLEDQMKHRLLEPLGLQRTGYNAAQHFALAEIAPTEVSAATGAPWRGVVHDEAARALAGVAGNAGLFSTAGELGVFAAMWLNRGAWQGQRIVSEAMVQRALTDAVPAESYNQAQGWHCDVSSWMSRLAPPGTAGHLGFTGPMLWICPQQGKALVVLNNRVYPTREGPRRMNLLRELSEKALDNRTI